MCCDLYLFNFSTFSDPWLLIIQFLTTSDLHSPLQVIPQGTHTAICAVMVVVASGCEEANVQMPLGI